MTAPAASGTLYASLADLRNSLSGTDEGVGTPAQLTDGQLTLALYGASNTVSVYAGSQYDGSTQQAQAPGILHDLTLDLAVFRAWKIYLKGKEISATHPAFIAYTAAMKMLEDVRTGNITLDPAVAPGIGSETGTVINRIPQVFTGEDSNTRVGNDGILQADSPYWSPRGALLGGGAEYQG